MKPTTRLYLVPLLTASLACAWLAPSARAVPYASKLVYSGGTVSFILNEAADNVKIVAGGTTYNLGALPKGAFSTNLTIAGTFSVVVSRSAPGGWTQASDDANTLVKFNSPRGISVNRNPASPYFGRVYIANSATGTAGGRPVGDGIYMLNADQTDAVAQGNTARTGGLDFSSSIGASPYRVSVGEDDNLYICDWSDATGGLLVTDPDVSPGSGVAALKPLVAVGTAVVPVGLDNTHGSVAAVIALGSLAQGNLTLFVVDEDLATDKELPALIEMNSLWRFDVGAGPLPFAGDATPPLLVTPQVNFVSQTMDLARGPSGLFYVSDRRSSGNETGLKIVDEYGGLWFDSRQSSLDLGETVDALRETGALAVSPDGKYLATLRYDNSAVLVTPLVDGIPDLLNRTTNVFFTAVAAGRGIAYDAAGNLHVVSSGHALYRVFSAGGTTVATTGSDGTFSVAVPPATVTVAATVDTTTEGSATAGEFTLTRVGDTSKALTVNYNLAGTASNGVDYVNLPGTATFAAGAASVIVSVKSLEDAVSEATETVVLTITGSAAYTAGTPGSATVNIIDNDTPQLNITVTQPTAYERTEGDYVTFRLNRLGDLASEVTANITYSGTAASGDYTGPATVTVPYGEAAQTFTVSPVDNSRLDGDRTVIATVANGADYIVGADASATATIIDDELPSEAGKILFSETFDTDTSANWTVLFGANNDVDDKQVEFGYDYWAWDGIPPAPGGSTTGLKLTVNKFDATAAGAAGVNLYAKNKTFSGDYALRFNMCLLMNGGAGTTEHAVFGINHSGSKTNWVRMTAGGVINPAAGADGLWFGIVADGYLGNLLYTGTDPAAAPTVLATVDSETLTGVFKYPPFTPADTGIGGAAANSSAIDATKNWVDVEVKYVGNVITMSINKTVLFQMPNSTAYTSGKIMLGYNDQWDSVGDLGAVYYDNVRVVDLTSAPPPKPSITSFELVGNDLRVYFTSPSGAAADFSLVSAAVVTGPYQPVAGATVQQVGPDAFQAVVARGAAPMQFYRIRR